jgi:hypothetical protein
MGRDFNNLDLALATFFGLWFAVNGFFFFDDLILDLIVIYFI